jgi:arylsulfatase A-like enzyme/Tfp pilus assembly protein PilF
VVAAVFVEGARLARALADPPAPTAKSAPIGFDQVSTVMEKQTMRPLRQRRLWLMIAVVLVPAIGLFGWRAFERSRRPNVLLITLDTTRADRLGCYGYASALTPALDSLAAKGVLFERAYTPAPLTLPSHASMMTGLYPPEHGLVTNGRGRLDESIPTLAEIFRDAGYDTAAFVGSFVLDAKFGLQRGFAAYDDDMTNTRPTEHGLHRQRDGVRVVDSALAWLQRHGSGSFFSGSFFSGPFFCWVHLYDAHVPYSAHVGEFGDRFKDSPYDGEIAYVDQQIGRLTTYLESHALAERTLVVVVGDHGEGLGDHHEPRHGLTLYNSVLRVPLICTGFGVTAAGTRVAQPVSLVDLLPTVLEAVGLRDPGSGDRSSTSGRSLSAALVGREIAAGDCYSATDEPLLEHGWSPLRCLTTSAWRYIRSPEVELYDLGTDPQETQNVATVLPDQVQELEDRLAALEKSMLVRGGAAVQLSPRERKALESLGYAGGNDSARHAAAAAERLPDVKRMLPIYNEVEAAHELLLGGDAPAAEKRLRELWQDMPDYVPTQCYLAESLTRQKRFGESREVVESILNRDPDNGKAHFQLGEIYWEQQQFVEAVKELRISLMSDPTAEAPLFALAQALMQVGRLEEAKQSYLEVIEQNPFHVEAHTALANLLAGQKHTAQADLHFREALKYTPDMVEAHSNLAVLLVGQQRLAEAGEHFKRAVELSPNNAEAQYNYGSFLLLQGHIDEAIRALDAAVRINPQHLQARTKLNQARNMRPR